MSFFNPWARNAGQAGMQLSAEDQVVQRALSKVAQRALSDSECRAAWERFSAGRWENASNDSRLEMLNAFSSASPSCARWVAARLAEVRQTQARLEDGSRVLDIRDPDAECADRWRSYAARFGREFSTYSAVMRETAYAEFRRDNPGCSPWLDRNPDPERATGGTTGGTTGTDGLSNVGARAVRQASQPFAVLLILAVALLATQKKGGI